MKKRLMLDIDGVIADFVLGFTTAAKTLGLIDAPYSTREQEGWAFPFDESKVWGYLNCCPNWWLTLEPLVSKYEVQCLADLCRAEGIEVHFLTSRPEARRGMSVTEQARLWLTSVAGWPAEFESWNVACSGNGNKGLYCVVHEIQLAVDDRPENVKSIEGAGIRAWLYLQSYNRGTGLTSVDGWEHLLRHLRGFWRKKEGRE